MPKTIQGMLDARGKTFGITVSRFNEFIASRLRDGAVDTLQRHGCAASDITEVWVPGAFELPLAAKKLAASGRYDAVIALGCLIRGATPHFDHLSNAVVKELARVALDSEVPVALGVLTANTIEQAVERAGSKAGNKGVDAAAGAIEMVNLVAKIPGGN